ncbi:galactokinase [bacterium M21]|nr:galactokinase [bacterium M21]
MSTKAQVLETFTTEYGSAPQVISRAPGRLEILGNHTDYNEGFTLSCAVDKSTFFAASPVATTMCKIYDLKFEDRVEFDLAAMGDAVPGDWTNFIKGVIVELQGRGHELCGFNAVLFSELPLSSGMSSSAALEVSASLALGQMNNIELSDKEWAKVGQASENNFVGANTGLLDQFTSIMGEHHKLVHSDFRTLDTTTCAVPDNVAIVIANSHVKHDLTQDYNERRQRCEEAAAALCKPFLRDVTMAELEASKPDMDIMAYRRALHIVGENERVDRALEALASNDIDAFGKIWLESHESSRTNFENSCPELDQLVEMGSALPGFLGARLSGGGFGGISIHLVEKAEAETYRRRLATAFETMVGKEPLTMITEIGQGAEIYV